MVSSGTKLGLSFFLGLALVSVEIPGTAFAADFYASLAKKSASSADVGIDQPGNAIFSWTIFTPQGVVVQLRKRSAGGNFTAAETLSTTGHDAQPPHLAVNGNGAAVVVWQVLHGDVSATTPVQGRARAADGTLGPIFTVDPQPGQTFSFDSANPKVAIDDAGNAVFAWIGLDSSAKRVVYARTRSATGTLGPINKLSPAGVSEVRMSVNGGGAAVFVWVWNDGAGHNQIQAIQLSAGGTLGSAQIIAQGIAPSGGGGLGTGNPQAGLDPNGNALIVWEQPDGQGACGINGCPKILSRTLSNSGVIGAVPQTLTTTVDGGFSPQVAVDKHGRAVVAWLHSGVEFRTRTTGGTLGVLQNFTTATDAAEPALKGDPAGDTVAIWNSSAVIQARTRSAAGVLGSIGSHSVNGQAAGGGVLAVGTRGKPVVGWIQSDGLGQCSGGSSCSRVGATIHP